MQAVDAYRSVTRTTRYGATSYAPRATACSGSGLAARRYLSRASKRCPQPPPAYLRQLAVTLAASQVHRRPGLIRRVLLHGQVRRFLGDSVLCQFVDVAGGGHYTGRIPLSRFVDGPPRVGTTFDVGLTDRGTQVEVSLRTVEPPDLLRDPVWLAGHRQRVESLAGVDEWLATSLGGVDGKEAHTGSEVDPEPSTKADGGRRGSSAAS